jgi:hypothetical protein
MTFDAFLPEMTGSERQVRLVLTHGDARSEHDRESTAALSRWIATLIGGVYGGDHTADCVEPAFIVPRQTLTTETARALGIVDEEGFLGGVVAAPILGTKAISHPLFGRAASAPPGWAAAFSERVCDVVLPGFTAFEFEVARAAGRELLKGGAVRLKPVNETGGLGQMVARSMQELERALSELGRHATPEQGIVLERNLQNVRTYSVGQIRLAGMVVSYIGEQSETPTNSGDAAYGGSVLRCIRGEMGDLRATRLSGDEHAALSQAVAFDCAAEETLPGFLASRRNYDIATGQDEAGHSFCGVLEQSWRIGGATGAELAAIEIFQQVPEARLVIASTVERYGPQAPPDACRVIYHGVDPTHGPMLKYARVNTYE